MCSGMRLGRDDLVELNSCACAQCARGHVRKCKCKSIVSPLRLTHSLLHARSFAGRHVWPCAGTCARHRVVTGACRHERMRQCICENAGLVSRSPGTRIHPRRHAYRRAGAQARRRAGAQVARTHARANTRTHSTGHGDRVRAVGHAERDAEGAVVLCGLARVGVRVCAAHVHACLFMDNLLEHG